mmetsp:Transcript_3214/g.6701  ORF Transcript_3214/g.6701 Transcript_3214/m.6701 type:complete len:262 (-) Transcript_3214:626-1411(-)
MSPQLPCGRITHIPRHRDAVSEVAERARNGLRMQPRRDAIGVGRLEKYADHVAQRDVDLRDGPFINRSVWIRERGAHGREARPAGASRAETDDRLLVAEDALGRLAPRAALVVAEAVERLQSILLRERQPPRAVATVDRSRISLGFSSGVAAADLWGKIVGVRVVVGPDIPERRPRLHCREPALHMRPPGIGAYEQPLIVGQRCGHSLQKRREHAVHERNVLAEEERSALSCKRRIYLVHECEEVVPLCPIVHARRQPTEP